MCASSPDVHESAVACVGQIMANKGCNGQQTVSDKGRVCLEWQIKDIGAASALRSGVNVHLHDNSHFLLTLHVSRLSVLPRLVIMGA